MAISFAPSSIKGIGERKDLGETMTDLTLDNSSYSSGFAITPANVRLQSIDSIDVVTQVGSTIAGDAFHWDSTNGKLRGYRQSAATGALTESVAAEYASTQILRLRAKGVPNL